MEAGGVGGLFLGRILEQEAILWRAVGAGWVLAGCLSIF